jgi:hypothetical protein
MFMGIDNRQLLPPFFPLYSNEDGVFGHCFELCAATAYTGHIPLSLIHDPDGDRSYSPDRWTTIRVSDAVLACVALCCVENGAADLIPRQRRLARRLMALASMPARDFVAELRNGLWQRTAVILARHARLLAAYGAKPEFWASELQIEDWRLRSAVQREDYIVPLELARTCNPVEALCVLQRLVFQFGELLLWWPDIVSRAKSLRACGGRTVLPS